MPEVQSRTYANPRRLLRRNHYQEGPGFLFVATQGGRPPEGETRRTQAAIVRRRRAALRRWVEGEPVATICAELGCGRASLFRWRARYEVEGLAGLLDRPRVGRTSELPPAIERPILTVRLLTDNYHRLHGELDWQTPGERFDGTPFTDRGFGSVPALAGVAELLDAILAA